MDQNTEDNISQSNPPADELQQVTPKANEDISVSDAITGVITEPGDTFESVKNSSKRNYWIVPTIIFIVVSLIASYLIMNDEELFSEIKAKQMQAAKDQLEQQVKSGNLTREQMNEQIDRMDSFFKKGSIFFLITSTIGPLFTIIILLFLKSLIFWSMIKLLKGVVSYMLVVCVVGLLNIIASIQGVIDTVLAIITGTLTANIGPALLVTEENVGQPMMKLLSHLDILNFWYFILLGIGLAKISNLKSGITIPAVFALWFVWIVLTSFLKIPFVGL
jgi:hypothetical protein